ncbi:MAG: DUF4282 domain-containing protein [Proteobacteria bacterium]|nr:DUF4282 domain-containing protein [Pseudomonadota bacterium]
MKFSDLFTFEKFVAPLLVKVVYWIGLFFIVLTTLAGIFGLGSMMGSYGMGGGGFSIGGAILSLILGIVFALLWRVICEIYIVIFSINERLGVIADNYKK